MSYVTAAQLQSIELSTAHRVVLANRATETITVAWFGTRIMVCFDDPVEAGVFRARYRSFLTSGGGDLRSYAIRGDNGEPIFWTEPGEACRWPGTLRKPTVIAFLADAVTQKAFFNVHPRLISFHAAALQVDDAAIAISARSTGGKSTTAVACTRRGMGLYTDERCVISGELVHPFPRAMNIRKEAMQLLTSGPDLRDGGIGHRLRLHAGQEWKFVSFADLLGYESVPQPRPLQAVFFIDGRGSSAGVTPLPLDEAVTQLMCASLCGPPSSLDRVAAATAIFQRARGYALTLGAPDETAQLIGSTVCGVAPLAASLT